MIGRCVALCLCLCGVAQTAQAQGATRDGATKITKTAPATKLTAAEKRMVEALSGLEAVPEAGTWARTPEAAAGLRHIAVDQTTPLFVRVRAVGALTQFPTEETWTLLTGMAAGGEAPMLRREALLTLARAFGLRAGTAAVCTQQLDDASPVVRRGAARALGLVGGAAERRSLQARRGVEKDAGVIEALDEALARIAAAAAPTGRSPTR